MIELHALGRAEILTGSAKITPSQEIIFAAALYLILEGDKPINRARLALLFWGDVPRAVRSHRLRQTLLQLKRVGLPLQTSRETVEIPQNVVRTDLDHFVESFEPSLAWANTLEFLPGYEPEFSPQFADWLDIARERAHARIIETLVPKLDQARNSCDWTTVNRLTSQCLSLDRFNETAVLAQAEAFAMRGQKTAAISILDSYINEISPDNPALRIPASVLRKRVQRTAPTPTPPRFVEGEIDCVGRQAELAFLTGFVMSARHCHGAACLVAGEPGIGKTRICSEVARFAELQGVRVQRFTCKRSDANQPLSAFVSLVPKIRDLPGALGVSEQSLSSLKRLTEFDAGEEGRLGRDDPGTGYTDLKSGIFDLLDAVSEEGCLMVVVDDVQWLDPTSAKLFSVLLEWIPNRQIFLLFNSRTHSLIEDYCAPDRLSVIKLLPLNDADGLAVIKGVIAQSAPQFLTSELDWLIKIGDGNPYFLQELTKHWIETGRRQEVPPSVVGVLNERVSRLSAVSKQLLQACALLAEHSNFQRLEHLLELPTHELLSGLEELSAAGMLRLGTSADPAHQSLQVRHDLLATVAVNGLTPASRAFLHRRCGLVLEREVLGSSISISLLRACAFHWRGAGDTKRAYELAIKCASYLLEIGLAVDATAALEGVLSFCSTTEQQLEVLNRIVQAQRLARESISLLETIARIRALQESRRITDHHDELEITEFEARRTTEREIAPLFSRTQRCIYSKDLHASHRVSVAAVALKLATSLGELAEIERIFVEIMPLVGDPTVDPRSRLQVQVIYNTMCGDFREAVRFAKERIALERTTGAALQLSNAMTDLAFVLRRAGPEEEIPAVLEEAYELATSRKLYAAARDYAERLAAFLIDTGRPGAEPWMERARESHGEAPETHNVFSANLYCARVALGENRVEEAERIVNESLPWDWLAHRHGWRAAAIAVRLRVKMAKSLSAVNLQSDIAELQSLYDRTSKLGGQDYEVTALCAALAYVGEVSRAREYLADYLAVKRRDLVPRSRELEGVCEFLLGQKRVC